MAKKIFTLNNSTQTVANPTFNFDIDMSQIPKYSIITQAIITFSGKVGFVFLVTPQVKVQVMDASNNIRYTSATQQITDQNKKFNFTDLHNYFASDETIQKIQIIGTGTYRYWEFTNIQLEIIYTPPTFQIIIEKNNGGTVSGNSEIITVTPNTTITRTFKAIPNQGYSFSEWRDSNNTVTQTPTFTININDQIITQNKTIIKYTPFFTRDNSIYVGNKKVKQIYLGTILIKKLYIGNQCIYKNTGS